MFPAFGWRAILRQACQPKAGRRNMIYRKKTIAYYLYFLLDTGFRHP
jgi:hypothetical protein